MPTRKKPEPQRTHARRKPGRTTKLTLGVQAHIAEAIRRGAFDHVAAQSAGIAPSTFREWIARGEGTDPDRPSTPEYAAFAAEVRQARAAARVEAEVRVFKERPLEWLRLGPGRDKADEPGWTETARTHLEHTGKDGGPIEFVSDWSPITGGSEDEIEDDDV